jgi:hypothetical protein
MLGFGCAPPAATANPHIIFSCCCCCCCPQAAAALEQLESYPHEPEVHAYLLDRLTRVAGLTALYELHYLAITLGKVWCMCVLRWSAN